MNKGDLVKGISSFAQKKAAEIVYSKINSMPLEEIEESKRGFFKDLNQLISKNKHLIKDIKINIEWKEKGGEKK